MKTLITLSVIVCALITGQVAAQSPADEIIGVWDAGEGDVEVTQAANGRYIGNPLLPDGTRKTAVNILDLEYEGGQWSGKIYNRKKEKYFDVVCNVMDNTLEIRVTAGFMKKTLAWTKAI